MKLGSLIPKYSSASLAVETDFLPLFEKVSLILPKETVMANPEVVELQGTANSLHNIPHNLPLLLDLDSSHSGQDFKCDLCEGGNHTEVPANFANLYHHKPGEHVWKWILWML